MENKQEKINKLIDEVFLKTKGNQMSKSEYYEISKELGGKNLLVFGTGYDSDLWRLANKGGKTIFLENQKEWLPKDKTDVIEVNYNTNISDYINLLDELDKLEMILPKDIKETEWDVIIVDSPTGYSNNCPGRMQSIYTSKILSNQKTIIYVHDYNRIVEKTYVDTFFNVLSQVDRLVKCKLK